MNRWGPRSRFALLAVLVCIALPARAENYLREEVRIPMAEAGSAGLEAWLVRADRPGRLPLALISHGSPRNPADRSTMTPGASYPMALEFARRGFAALIVMRRGYGNSGGDFAEDRGSCSKPDYVAAGRAGVRDLKAAIAWAERRNDIDTNKIVAIGHSAGGFATVALTAEPPPNLAAAISFAGGRGSSAADEVCGEDRLVDAFRTFGKTSRLPMLWVYAANDHFFAPALASRFRDAFAGAGGNVQFVAAAAFGEDGHQLFSRAGIPIWTSYVDAFFAKQVPGLAAVPMALPALKAPPQLAANGKATFEQYLHSAPHKAFAITADGHFGWATGKRTADEAKATAVKFCQGADGRNCRIVLIDDATAP